MKRAGIAIGIVFVLLVAALYARMYGVPYPGTRVVTPERRILVEDTNNAPLAGYDLYVYRCTQPGSQFDRVQMFPAHAGPELHLSRHTEIGIKRAGGFWFAPDAYAAFEPEPYWVACVEKPGYASRRWSLSDDSVEIALTRRDQPGPERCTIEDDLCNPCRSYEYFMYEDMRFGSDACWSGR